MRKTILLTALVALLGFRTSASAHCEVPCGIYGDQQRFVGMLEDHKTVAKAIDKIIELAGKTDAQSHNQLARWVLNKETHATKVQHTIAQYFMTQRIKPSGEKYVQKLTAAHAVMLAAMKCKQKVDATEAGKLRAAILSFYEAYEGKKPDFDGK